MGRSAFRGIGDAREVASFVVFLEGLPAERINHFGDLLKDVVDVFSRVFVAVDLLLDLASAVVFGFGDRFVGFFDLGPLVVGIVGVCRLVAFRVGHGFDVAVAVVGVFRFVAERVSDLDGAALCVAFCFSLIFFFFPGFDVPARADHARFLWSSL